MEQKTIAITGMSCGHCVAGVKRALSGIEGVDVKEVTVGSATVGYDPNTVTADRITQAIEAEGYRAEIRG